MDLGSLGIDVGVIIAIGAITEQIKKIKGIEKYKRFFILMPLLLSVLIATTAAIGTKNYSAIPLDIIKYTGITLFGYGFIKKTVLKK